METPVFWIVALGMALAVAMLLIASYWQAGRPASASAESGANTGAEDRRIYRDQLAEVERDLARGTLAAPEAKRLRTEIARRLLEADRNAATNARVATRPLWAAALIALLVVPGAAWLYHDLGAPGYPDLPLKERIAAADQRLRNRPTQAEAEAGQPAWVQPALDAQYDALITKLRAAVDPASATDPEGLRLLAVNEARLGNFRAAIPAQRRLIAVLGDTARAGDHAGLADLLIGAAGGYVSPEAETELVEALRRDPEDQMARYYSGLLFAQVGRYDRAFQLWKPLATTGAADAPWMPALRQDLPQLAELAGVSYDLPPLPATAPLADTALRGPDADAVAAASGMDAADRQAMIEGMVSSLSDRLAREGGSPAEWAQLIGALGVLGQQDQALAIWTEAKTHFADDPAALEQLTLAAKAAGIAE